MQGLLTFQKYEVSSSPWRCRQHGPSISSYLPNEGACHSPVAVSLSVLLWIRPNLALTEDSGPGKLLRFHHQNNILFSYDSLFRPYSGPGVDSASNRNEYQEYFLVDKGGRCVGLTTLPPSCAECLEIWEPQITGNLRDCPLLYLYLYPYWNSNRRFKDKSVNHNK